MEATDDSTKTAPPPDAADAAPPRPSRLLGHLRARAWVYATWYVMGCLAASALWANSRDGGPAAAISAFVYLLICTAALTAPGALVAQSGLAPRSQRSLLLGVLAIAAAMIAGTMSTGLLWATPPFILLLGNAIWSIEEIDRRLEAK